MKKRLLLSILTIFCIHCNVAAQLRSTTSEAFELSSIAFRLAGAEEYMRDPISSYANDIDKYFASHSDHRLIEYIKEIRNEYLLGYDAVANGATNLVVEGGEIVVSDDFDISKIGEIDKRWTVEAYSKYVELMSDFYKESNFNKFYSDHKKIYAIATSRLDKLLKDIDTTWFASFFGEELGDVRVVAALCTGNCNYAFSMPNKDNGFGIVIGCRADGKGLPRYSELTPKTIIHELSHCFTNKLIDSIWSDIKPAALKIYPHVEQRMWDIAIGSPYNVMTEWFTDLCANMYFKENGVVKGISPVREIASQQIKGFIWMEKSVDFMNGFYQHRDLYPTVKDYMPQIALFINQIVDNFDQVIADFDNMRPRIVEVSPSADSTVGLKTDRIVIRFSEPMDQNLYGYGKTNEEGVLRIPELKGDKEFWLNDTTFVIPLNSKALIPNKKYGINLNKYYFISVKQYPLAEDYTFYFNTTEK